MAFVQVTLFYVALFTGMRESELIGLSWDCVDWDHETIHLYRQLKRARGKGAPWVFTTLKNRQDRTFTVPHSVMAVLQKARRKQAEWKLSHGQLFQNTDNLVFTNELGEHLATHTVWKQFKQIVSQLGLPEVRFHDLRHPDVKQATKNNEYLIEFLKIMRIDTLLQVHYSPFLSSKASWRVVSISIRLS